jgi:hypothetical protein
MSAIWSWIIRLVGGWLPIGQKPFPEWIGKILWVVGIYMACYFILGYIFPQKNNITTIGQGGVQIVQQAEPRDVMGIGCNVFRLYLKGGIKSK